MSAGVNAEEYREFKYFEGVAFLADAEVEGCEAIDGCRVIGFELVGVVEADKTGGVDVEVSFIVDEDVIVGVGVDAGVDGEGLLGMRTFERV